MWLEAHQSLARHPKMFALCERLKISEPQAIGHLMLFWWWVLDYAQDGDLTDCSPAQLAKAAHWLGDANEFLQGLEGSGFIDHDDAGKRVHDWDDYAGKLLAKREAERTRLRKLRKKEKRTEKDGVRTPYEGRSLGSNLPTNQPIPTNPPKSPPSRGGEELPSMVFAKRMTGRIMDSLPDIHPPMDPVQLQTVLTATPNINTHPEGQQEQAIDAWILDQRTSSNPANDPLRSLRFFLIRHLQGGGAPGFNPPADGKAWAAAGEKPGTLAEVDAPPAILEARRRARMQKNNGAPAAEGVPS